MKKSMTSTLSVPNIAKISITAALYAAVTVLLSPLSFGVIQLRFSEMFNYLALENKRYIYGVTLGVFLANFASPTWIYDVPIGTLSTFLILMVARFTAKHLHSKLAKYVVTGLLVVFSMCSIAGELAIFYHAPFWYSWLTIGLGELASMTFGGLIMWQVTKRIDLKN